MFLSRRVHLSTEPKPPKKEVPPPAPAPSASQYRFGNILTSSDPRFTQLPQPGSQAWAELRKNLLTGYPGQGVDASGRMNAYGDSEASISFLAGRGPNPYSWSASSAAAGPSRSLATGAGHAGHSAVLGPTGLAPTSELYAPVKPYGYSSDDDAGIPLWRRGLEEYSGGDRVYTEAETLSFFKDAAAGYDFNEEGEKALEEALVTIGLEKQGDIFPGYVNPMSQIWRPPG